MPGLVSRIKGALSQTAARYQIRMMASTRVRIGKEFPAKALDKRGGRASIKSNVIGVTRAQTVADTMGDTQEFLGVTKIERAVRRKVAIDDVDDAAGPRRHHNDAGG